MRAPDNFKKLQIAGDFHVQSVQSGCPRWNLVDGNMDYNSKPAAFGGLILTHSHLKISGLQSSRLETLPLFESSQLAVPG